MSLGLSYSAAIFQTLQLRLTLMVDIKCAAASIPSSLICPNEISCKYFHRGNENKLFGVPLENKSNFEKIILMSSSYFLNSYKSKMDFCPNNRFFKLL